jgi:ABC-type branched-subunit amino acid transport system substrate-binding protein
MKGFRAGETACARVAVHVSSKPCRWIPSASTRGGVLFTALRLSLAGLLLAGVAPQRSGSQETSGEPGEVRIGYFGPDDADHPVGGAIWKGTKLAIEESNAAGGYQGMPFRLVQDWDENPWSGGAASVVRMVYQERVWAVIGGIDGASTHLAEQVVAKAQLVLIDPASTDRTVNSANVPWIFSCMPVDRVLMAAIGDALLASPGRESFILASATDHDSRIMAEVFLAFVQRKHIGPQRHLEFQSGSHRIPGLAKQIAESETRAVVVLAGASDSAALVRELRTAGAAPIIFGGPSLGRRTFLDRARSAAEGVRLPLTFQESGLAAEFSKTFEARWNVAPDYAAFHAYDSTRLLVAAIRRAGLDRAQIRAALAELSPWKGVSGTIRWDEIGRNSRGARLGTIRNGQVRATRRNGEHSIKMPASANPDLRRSPSPPSPPAKRDDTRTPEP